MFPFRYSSIFRSRWMALLWSAGIVWMAVDVAGTGFITGGRKQITTWLHRSLIENKPYDQFVRELIAPTAESRNTR